MLKQLKKFLSGILISSIVNIISGQNIYKNVELNICICRVFRCLIINCRIINKF